MLLCPVYSLSQTAEECYNSGLAKLQLKDFSGAIVDYTKAIGLDPKYKEAYYNRSKAKYGLQDFKGTIADLTKTVELDPKYAQAYMIRGIVKTILEDYKGAIADYTKAIKINEQDTTVYLLRGMGKVKLHDFKGAIKDYTKALELDPKYKEAYYNSGNAKDSLQDYNGAIVDYTKAIELEPNHKYAYVTYISRAKAKGALHDYKGSIEDLNKAIEITPKYAEAYYIRGLAKLMLNQIDSGCLDLSKAGELGNKDAYEAIKKSQCFNNETHYKKYFKENLNKLDPIEGIYSISSTYSKYYKGVKVGTDEEPNSSVCAIIKHDDDFILCDLQGYNSIINYSKFSLTSIEGLYLWKNSNSQFHCLNGANAKLTNKNFLEFSYKGSEEEIIQHYKYAEKELNMAGEVSDQRHKELIRETQLLHEFKLIKTFPTEQEKSATTKSEIVSGTGFAISSKPYIVTNYHVISKANTIKVRGVNNDYSSAYPAEVVLVDKNNDLAILKIKDPNVFLGDIPFSISAILSDVGENVSVLGYPLRATMGDELKLTNGIISSRTGFQMDISSYQISAPVQPGNSGGPVFNSNGTLIGILNAKHTGAENVSYAIKSTYLLNLIDLLPEKIDVSHINQLNGKPLPEQVKIIRNFVYIIESD